MLSEKRRSSKAALLPGLSYRPHRSGCKLAFGKTVRRAAVRRCGICASHSVSALVAKTAEQVCRSEVRDFVLRGHSGFASFQSNGCQMAACHFSVASVDISNGSKIVVFLVADAQKHPILAVLYSLACEMIGS